MRGVSIGMIMSRAGRAGRCGRAGRAGRVRSGAVGSGREPVGSRPGAGRDPRRPGRGRSGRSRRLDGGMSETTFPRRDADGRVVHLVELIAWVGAGLVLGFVVLLVIDGVSSLLGA